MSEGSIITLVACLAASALYAVGCGKLWSRSRRARARIALAAAAGGAGFAGVALTLVPPLHHWSEELFTFHMISHSLLMTLAAPLLILARPGYAMLSGLPRPMRRVLARCAAKISESSAWRILTQPLVATFLHGVVIWFWHLPAFFTGALQSEWLHWFQHASFFIAALLFWQSILGNRSSRSDLAISVACLFVTMLHTGLLGALLTFSTRLWYPPAPGAAAWGLSASEDQQLAGLLMWIAGGFIYFIAALLLTGRLISPQPIDEGEFEKAVR